METIAKEYRIIVEGVSKKFRIDIPKNFSFLGRLRRIFNTKSSMETIEVLDKMTFRIDAGEIVGVIGSNGSGKSTLLRIIAGIYKPDSGSVMVNGRVISLINLIVGLQERLTMKDNIYLVGSLFGMGHNQIKAKFDVIVSFSGLENFVNEKVYKFSNGMLQRLVFSIAVHASPDILLLDEVFEVGDENFKERSGKKIVEIAQGGGGVVLVSHDMNLIKKYCNRVIAIDNVQSKFVLGSGK